MRILISTASLLFLVVGFHPLFATAQTSNAIGVANNALQPQFDYDQALKLSQGALGNQLRDHTFTNIHGQQQQIKAFQGKPLLLSMVYTSCYQICPMTIQHLAKIVGKARDTLGDDSFSVAIVGFDTPFDTPEAMQYFANKQGISELSWNLLSADPQTITALSEDVGFIYFPSSNGFDHIIQTTIIDPDGKVYRQVYGQVFDTPLLVDPLIDLVYGRPKPAQSILTGLSDKIKLFCTTYDPVTDGYYFDYSLFLGILIGASIILVTAIAMGKESSRWRK